MAFDGQHSSSEAVCLSVPARVENLHIIRYVVQHVAENFGFAHEDAVMIQMAVDEACTNVILHGYEVAREITVAPPLYVRLFFRSDRLIIQIVDQARKFSPLDMGDISIEEYVESGGHHGLGIYIMRSFMDEVTHDYSEDEGNRLQLVKFLTARPAEGASQDVPS